MPFYFLKHLFVPVVSVPKCQFKIWQLWVSNVLCPYIAWLSGHVCWSAIHQLAQKLILFKAEALLPCSAFSKGSPSFIALTIICHVGDLKPFGAIPFIGLKLNPQFLWSGGEGNRAFIGLAGFICRHRIGWSCQGKLERGTVQNSSLSRHTMNTYLFKCSHYKTSYAQELFRPSWAIIRAKVLEAE